MKPNDYVITTKNKLGILLLPGVRDPVNKNYKPASVQLNNRVYEIWSENLRPVTHIDLQIMEGRIILTAEKAFKLIQTLLKNRISVEIMEAWNEPQINMDQLQKELFNEDKY